MRRLTHPLLVVAVAALVLVGGTVVAEAQGRGGRPSGQGQGEPVGPGGERVRGQGIRPGGESGRRRGGLGGRMDPARMREMMLQRLQEDLGCTDQEWQAISPLVGKVIDAQSEARMGRFGGGRGGPEAESNTEVAELRAALDSEDTPAEEIAAKLKAYRDARKKKEEALAKARDELRKVLTVRQEASLVLRGGLLD